MKPPSNTKTFESELAVFWFDDDGILYAQSKEVKQRTLQMQIDSYEIIKKMSGNKKVCLLADTTSGSTQDREIRDYVAKEMSNVFKAMAVISGSHVGRFIAKLFISLKQPPIPIRMFEKESEAKKWLKQHL